MSDVVPRSISDAARFGALVVGDGDADGEGDPDGLASTRGSVVRHPKH